MTEGQPQTLPFQAEIQQLLDLVIHSLYSHPEIFLRELLSNASDALDTLRFRAVTEPELLTEGGEAPLEVRIVPDAEKGTLTITDTGIGMSRDELVQNLGTIAHSGSKAFLQQLAARGQKDVSLIGQFGVGFYSAYLVADRVEVVSRPAGKAAQAHRWASDAKGSFTVAPVDAAPRGTSVVLHLKAEQKEFLDPWRLKELVRRYSDYLSHPIQLVTTTGGDAKVEALNQGSALWLRNKAEVTDAQYEEFYKHLSHDWEPPLARTHFTSEGNHLFTGLLFVPKQPPLELDDREQRGVRLFVKRVLIMDRCEELVPTWLRFVRGVIDSDDLPLNVSRELLQDSAAVRTIRKQLTKKVLDLLERVAKDKPDDYATFWKGFGTVLKEGLAMDREYKDRLAPLLRFESSHGDGLSSLAEVVARMPAGQPAIYYAIGATRAAVASSPHLEALRTRGFEVLYLVNPVDDWAIKGLGEFEGKPLVSAMEADLKLESPEAQKQERAAQTSELKPLLDKVQQVLEQRVREVRLSDRLTDSPVCLVIPPGGNHAFLERLLRERGRDVPSSKRILEVNAGHPLVRHLLELVRREPESPRVTEWIELLHEQALLTEGSPLLDPNRFAKRMTALMQQVALGAAPG